MSFVKRQLERRKNGIIQNPLDKSAHVSAQELIRSELVTAHGPEWVRELWGKYPTKYQSTEEWRYRQGLPQISGIRDGRLGGAFECEDTFTGDIK